MKKIGIFLFIIVLFTLAGCEEMDLIRYSSVVITNNALGSMNLGFRGDNDTFYEGSIIDCGELIMLESSGIIVLPAGYTEIFYKNSGTTDWMTASPSSYNFDEGSEYSITINNIAGSLNIN